MMPQGIIGIFRIFFFRVRRLDFIRVLRRAWFRPLRQGDFQDLIDPAYRLYVEMLLDVFRHLHQVTLVFVRDDHRLDATAQGGQQLLLETTDRQGLTTQGDLPVIATSARTGIPVSAEVSDVAMPIPALGPSFGVAPSGTWMCTSDF